MNPSSQPPDGQSRLLDMIRSLARPKAMPDGRSYLSLGIEAVQRVFEQSGTPLREVEIAALENDIAPERYVRNFRSFSFREQILLLKSRVALIGLGGLGGHVLEILVRAGVGRVAGVDFDRFDESNLNRQLLCTLGNVGRPKVEAAAKRARELNPGVTFEGLEERVHADSLKRILAGANLVVDALGGLETRLELQQAAASAGIPLVTAAVAGMGGYAALIMPGEQGPASLLPKSAGAEESLGCPAPAAAAAAAMQAGLALALLRRGGELPSPGMKRVLFFDLADWSFDLVRL